MRARSGDELQLEIGNVLLSERIPGRRHDEVRLFAVAIGILVDLVVDQVRKLACGLSGWIVNHHFGIVRCATAKVAGKEQVPDGHEELP